MPDTIIEKFLHPGGIHVAGSDTRIHTVLGSCVAIVAWHRSSQLGGMSHYLLPDRRSSPREHLDGRYAGDALELLHNEFSNFGVKLRDCQINLFGGATMLSHVQGAEPASSVGGQNIEAAKRLMQKHGLVSHIEHLGGTGHRKLIFNIANGDVWMWRRPLAASI